MAGLKAFLAFFIVHSLSREDYGLYGLLTAALGIWIALSDVGWGDYLRREIPAMDEPTLNHHFRSFFTVQIAWMSFLFLVFFLFGESILLKYSTATHDYLPFRLSLPPLFFLAGAYPTLQIYLNFSKRIEALNKLTLGQMVLYLLFLLTFFKLNSELSLVLIISSWTLSLLCVFIYFAIRRRIFALELPSFSLLVKSLRYGFPMFLLDFTKTFLRNYDRYALGAVASLSAVAPYHFFNTLFDFSEKINHVTLQPYIFQTHDAEQTEHRNQLITSLIKTKILLQVLAVTCASLLLFLVPHILPVGYAEQGTLFLAIALTSVIRPLGQISYIALLLEKKTRQLAFSFFIGILVSIPLNLYWIPRYGALGAAFALFCSTAATIATQWRMVHVASYFEWRHFLTLRPEIEGLKNWLRKKREKNS